MDLFKQHIKLLTRTIIVFLITSFAFINNVHGANFKFKDFNYEEFAKQNLGYWTDICSEETIDKKEECEEYIISTQREYYTTLYKILAKYERQYPNIKIDDNIIITTTFLGLSPEFFNDDGANYKKIFSNNSPYTLLDEDQYLENRKDVELDFDGEIDTLDLLISNLFSYTNACYADYGDTFIDEDNNRYCEEHNLISINGSPRCGVTVSKDKVGFFDYLVAQMNNNFLKGVLNFFGLKSDLEKECHEKGSEYEGATMVFSGSEGREYNPDSYYNFLENSNYFDKKPHLQDYFTSVLYKLNKNSMSELTPYEYEEYHDDIVASREKITSMIKSTIEFYNKANKHLATAPNFTAGSGYSSSYWIPIGSAQTTLIDGAYFAAGEPMPYTITSHYGPRDLDNTGIYKLHGGTDFSTSQANNTNIIAAKDGIVVSIHTGCISGEGNNCGSTYGNNVVISHPDGNFTLYAHLHQDTITVEVNQPVKQGQVIGKMGDSGNSRGYHLHFELMIGANLGAARVNAMDGYLSIDDPRAAHQVVSQQFQEYLVCLEGKGPDDGGSNYIVYDDNGTRGGGTLTAGPGITLIYNRGLFAKQGLDIDDYFYAGAKIPKSIVDAVHVDFIQKDIDSITSTMNNAGIELSQNQFEALLTRKYNIGNINGFVDNYLKYGNTQALYDNYWSLSNRGQNGQDLTSRRFNEWNLFHNGIYFECYR